MRKLNFVYKHIISGGAESLILRLSKKIISEDENVTVKLICQSISTKMRQQFEKLNIQIIVLNCWTAQNIFKQIENSMEKTLFYNIEEFLLVNNIISKKKLINLTFLYVVHPNNTKIFSRKLMLLNKIMNKKFSSILKNLIYENRVIFMDEMCLNEFNKFYGLNIVLELEKFIRLPIDDFKIEKNCFKKRNSINLLTIARADFPFKGYIQGMINELDLADYKVNFTIVSFGPQFGQIKQWINRSKSKNLKISLHGETSYDELNRFYENTDLYVGMGTTVLEAAARKIPSVVVSPYTYSFKSSGFFHQNPFVVASDFDEISNGIKYIDQYKIMSDREISEIELKSYNFFKEYYSMQSFMKKINNLSFKSSYVNLNIFFILLFELRLKFR